MRLIQQKLRNLRAPWYWILALAGASTLGIILLLQTTSVVGADPRVTVDIRKQTEGADSRTVASGDDVDFEIVVTNTGEFNLVNVEVTDAVSPQCDRSIGNLAVGQSFTYGCTVLNVTADFENVARVDARRDRSSSKANDSDPSTVKIAGDPPPPTPTPTPVPPTPTPVPPTPTPTPPPPTPTPPPPPPAAGFLVIDEDSIDNNMVWWDIFETPTQNNGTEFTSEGVNEDEPGNGMRAQLDFFRDNVGLMIQLQTGRVGDEGWFAPQTIPDSWASAGPTADGLRNFLGLPVGDGLGVGDDPEALLDKIPDVTPLRATGATQERHARQVRQDTGAHLARTDCRRPA